MNTASSTVSTELDLDTVAEVAASFPPDRPVYMLNLLRYRPTAEYPDGSDADLSGRQVYLERYVTTFNAIADEAGVTGVEPIFFSEARGTLVGPSSEHWDDVALVRYPSFPAFRAIIDHPHYRRRADPHRHAALADWRLLASIRVDLGEPSS